MPLGDIEVPVLGPKFILVALMSLKKKVIALPLLSSAAFTSTDLILSPLSSYRVAVIAALITVAMQ